MRRHRSRDRARTRTPEASPTPTKHPVQILWERLAGARFFKRTEIVFWLIYLFAPMFTGWLDYRALPNEYFDPARHTVVKSHHREMWPQLAGDSYEVPDAWRDDATNTTYTAESFSAHHRSEAQRLGLSCFTYGLIGCAFFAYCRSMKDQSGFLRAFRNATIIDVLIALLVFWIT